MLLRALAVVAFALIVSPLPASAEGMAVDVWRNPSCGCCGKWARHMQAAGYTVTINEAASGVLARIKRQAGIAPDLASCHTAKIAGYVIEGHVPAADIERLLAEKPDAVGLALPGMPLGSPGMEAGGQTEPYEVLLVKKDGSTEVFARH